MTKPAIVARSGRAHSILLLGVMAGLVGMPLVWSVPQEVSGAFTSTDSEAIALITTLTPNYKPWVEAWWQSPGQGVEEFLLALQAALGAGGVGYCLGRRYSSRCSSRDIISRSDRAASFTSSESITDAFG